VAATIELVMDVADLDRMVAFYTAALGYEAYGAVGQYRSIVPPAGEPGLKIIFQQVAEAKTVKNRVHIDIQHPEIEVEAARLETLGAARVRRYEEFGMQWILMVDPEGNEVCICEG
jgi:predicted enzyme related to lactoylglutathione lyase